VEIYTILILGGAYQGKREFAKTLDTSDEIVIFEDIFCGVVPSDPETRALREKKAKELAALAKSADAVYRVFCGIGTRIK
jgi:adenosylcobinamide kinase/adenosylcobinamide-phosphate guanylyltransferase